MAEHEIAKVLVVSTAHLTHGEREQLFGENGDHPRAQYTHRDGWAAMLWVPKEGEPVFDPANAEKPDSEGLKGCLAIAREQGCAYVLFDCDANGYAHLPDYDEDDEDEEAEAAP